MASITLKETTVARLWVEYTTTTDISKNQSTTKLTLKLTTLNSYNIGPWGDFNGSYFGTTTNTFNGAIPNFSGTRDLASYTAVVNHSSDGKGSLKIYWKWGVNSSWGGFENPSDSFDVSLPTIPRVTTPVLSSDSVDLGKSVKITLNRALSSHTHDIAIYYGSKSLSIAKNIATEYTWTVPTSIGQWIPNVTSMECQLTVTTYQNGVKNGSVSVPITINIPTSAVPDIDSVTLTEANSSIGDFGLWISGMSQIKVVTSASGIYGSTIKSISSVIENVTYSGAEFTTNTIVNAGSLAVKVEVTDSRGRKSTSTKNITITDYQSPQILKFNARRCDSAGNIKENGTYARVEYSYKITSLNNKNEKNVKISYRNTKTNTYTDLFTSSANYEEDTVYFSENILDLSNSYYIKIEVSDSFASNVPSEVLIPTERVPLELLYTGLGVSIGKAAELDETFEVDLYTIFNKAVKFKSSPTFDNALTLTNGFTYKPMQISSGDLNTYTLISGVWYVSNADNRPVTSSGFLIVVVNGDNSIYQKFITLSGLTYERLKTSSGWTPWCGWYYYTVQGTQMWERVYVGLDGSYEAYGKRTISASYTTLTNGVYQMSYDVGLGLQLPNGIAIDGEPMCFVNATAANEYILCRYMGFTSSQTGSFVNVRFAKMTQGSSISTNAQVHVIGKWK